MTKTTLVAQRKYSNLSGRKFDSEILASNIHNLSSVHAV